MHARAADEGHQVEDREVTAVALEALPLGLACGAIGFAIYGVAPVGGLFLLGVPIMALWGVGGASAQSLMSRQVSPSEQGRLQGALSAVQAVAGIASPLIFNGVFAAFVGPWKTIGLPGAPFLLASVMVAIGIVQAVRVTRPEGARAAAA